MSKKIVENFLQELWNRKNLAIVDEVFADNAKFHSAVGRFQTKREITEAYSGWLKALPNAKIEFIETIEQGNSVVVHWRIKGTFENALNGIKPTGKPVEFGGMVLYHLKNGKISDFTAYIDNHSLEQGLYGSSQGRKEYYQSGRQKAGALA